jgi:hypothetical protein
MERVTVSVQDYIDYQVLFTATSLSILLIEHHLVSASPKTLIDLRARNAAAKSNMKFILTKLLADDDGK